MYMESDYILIVRIECTDTHTFVKIIVIKHHQSFVRVLETFATYAVEYKIAKVYIRKQVGLKCVRNMVQVRNAL
jgi:hypothetical protein